MRDLPSVLLSCPYCGERIELLVDGSAGRQDYVEDCSVCCRPIVVSVVTQGGEITQIRGRTEDE